MSMPTQVLRKLIEEAVRPLRPDLALKLDDAVDALAASTSASEESLTAVVEVASSSKPSMYETGAYLLCELASTSAPALGKIRQMAQAKQAHIRHNALLCIDRRQPSIGTIEIVSNALRDENVRVRRKAADWAGRLKLKAILPQLRDAAALEADPKTRDVMAHELALLRDGYVTTPAGPGLTFVTVDTSNGRVSRLIDSQVLETKGIALVAADLASAA